MDFPKEWGIIPHKEDDRNLSSLFIVPVMCFYISQVTFVNLIDVTDWNDSFYVKLTKKRIRTIWIEQ